MKHFLKPASALILLCSWWCCTFAHDASLIYVNIVIADNSINIRFSIPSKNFETIKADALISNPDSFVINYISRNFIVTNNGKKIFPLTADVDENTSINSFMVTLTYKNAIDYDSLLFAYNLFFEISPTHEAITDISYHILKTQIIFNKEDNKQLISLSALLGQIAGKGMSTQKKIAPDTANKILSQNKSDTNTTALFQNQNTPVITKSESAKSNNQTINQAQNSFQQQSAYNPFSNFFKSGVTHILTGYDHILFLIALLLVYTNFLTTLKVITSFTIAHSITLAIAVLNVYVLNPAVTEPLIALSIFIIAIENLFIYNFRKRNRPIPGILNPAKRWMITFLFGLIHGFGFSSVLRETGIPKNEIGISLVSFNLGVECGQLAIFVILIPAIILIRKSNKEVFILNALSVLVAIVGFMWFVLRVL
ncbi:MAG: HupE/UreJ family protein [Bacteroidia bacterium]